MLDERRDVGGRVHVSDRHGDVEGHAPGPAGRRIVQEELAGRVGVRVPDGFGQFLQLLALGQERVEPSDVGLGVGQARVEELLVLDVDQLLDVFDVVRQPGSVRRVAVPAGYSVQGPDHAGVPVDLQAPLLLGQRIPPGRDLPRVHAPVGVLGPGRPGAGEPSAADPSQRRAVGVVGDARLGQRLRDERLRAGQRLLPVRPPGGAVRPRIRLGLRGRVGLLRAGVGHGAVVGDREFVVRCQGEDFQDEDFDFAHPVLHGRRDGEQFAQTGQKQSGRVLQRGEPRAGRRRAVPRPFDAGVQIEHRRADASGLLAVIDQVVNHGLQA